MKSDTLRAADELFERFRSTGPYYDAAEDGGRRTEYYHGIDWGADPATLAAALNRRLRDGHDVSISYHRARHEFLYPSVDLHEDGLLHNIYSGTSLSPIDAIASELALVRPFAEAMGIDMAESGAETLLGQDELWARAEADAEVAFNCEHVVCQAWFDKRMPMKADLHHLFACEVRCNSFRDNIPYWQFPPVNEDMTDCGRRERPAKFEPKLGKGAVARATLYFALRYPGVIGDEAGELTRERLPILLDWHRGFAVTDYERHRNWLIAKAQGNRNPFIDRPEAATMELLAGGFGSGRVV